MIFTFKESKKLNRKDILFCLAEDPAHAGIVVGSSDAHIYALDPAAEKPESVVFTGEGHTSYVTSIARSGSQLITGSYDRRLIWWDGERRQSRHQARAHEKWIRDVVVSPDGKTLASVADDMVCRLWDADSGALKGELRGHAELTPTHYRSMLFTCAFHPSGELLATADKVGQISIWNLATGKEVKRLEAPTMYTWDPVKRRHSIGGVRSLAFSPDGQVLIAGGMGQVGNFDHLQGMARMRAFDWAKAETLAEMETDKVKGLVERITFARDGTWLAACGGDHKGFLLLVNAKTWKLEVEEQTPFHVHDFALSEAETQLVAVGHNGISASDRV